MDKKLLQEINRASRSIFEQECMDPLEQLILMEEEAEQITLSIIESIFTSNEDIPND